jgi:hypothetical protein
MWTEGAGARWRAHRSTASGHSGAPKVAGGGAKEREAHGELGSGLIRARAVAWRPSNGSGVKRSRETRWGGFLVWERRREGHGEVWGAPGVVGVPFIGLGEGAGEVAGVMAVVNGD